MLSVITASARRLLGQTRPKINKMTNFPTSLDSFTDPLSTDTVAGVDHAAQHTNINDSVAALETKVGADSSAVTTTLDYKLKSTSSTDPGHKHTEGSLTLADVTTDNVSSTAHGFAPKSPADATQFLNGAATPAFANVKDSDLATTDITTNNTSTSKHGFAPKLDNTSTHFLNGQGNWVTPGGSTAFSTTQVFSGTSPTSLTDLDLSSVVGVAQRVVMLKCTQGNGGSNNRIAFLRKGDTSATYNNSATIGVNSVQLHSDNGETVFAMTTTNTSGVVSWITSTGEAMTVNVEAYW